MPDTILENQFLGVIDDPRSEVEKAQDYQAEEVIAFGAEPKATWVPKESHEWLTATTRQQNGSGTCVAQAVGTLLEIDNVLEEPGTYQTPYVFSARDIYERRSNKPSGGMYGPNALAIASKFGACFESQLPSQNMSDAEINASFVRTAEQMRIADRYRAGGYVSDPLDMEKLGIILEKTKKGILIFVRFDPKEWTDVPKLGAGSGNGLRHGIVIRDHLLYKGERAFFVKDSWGDFNAWKGGRIITESFFKERVYYAGHLLDLANNRPDTVPPPQKPRFNFKRILAYGSVGSDVVNLQNMLKYEQFFPQAQSSTGNALQITMKGVKAWQLKHGLMDFANEVDMRKIRFGQKSIDLANKLYA